MKLLTQEIRRRLPALYSTEQIAESEKVAQVKFFTPTSSWTWYGVEFDGEDLFFGLIFGHEREWGYFRLSELQSVRGPFGVGVERDKWFKPTPVGELAKGAG